MRQRELMENMARGPSGPRYFPRTEVRKAVTSERHQLIQEEVQACVCEKIKGSSTTLHVTALASLVGREGIEDSITDTAETANRWLKG